MIRGLILKNKIPYNRNWFRRANLLTSVSNSPELPSNYEDLHKFSIDDSTNQKFWKIIAQERLTWDTNFTEVSKSNMLQGSFQWFIGGQLNVAKNCLDRHIANEHGDKSALIWEKDEPNQHEFVSFNQLHKMTNQIANLLKSIDVAKGDTVILYLSNCPVLAASMLACARIGAVHSVVFAGFSVEAVADRIIDAGAKVVITANQSKRGGKPIELKRTIDAAVARCPPGQVENVLVYGRSEPSELSHPSAALHNKIDLDLDKHMAQMSGECASECVDSEHPLFILYTSGSTGKPKGVVHSSAGYLLYSSFTFQQCFDVQTNISSLPPRNTTGAHRGATTGDVFGCFADVGWITGHSNIVYGPLCNGVTSLMFESTPTYPDAGRYWETVQRLGLTHVYLAPTTLRTLLKFGESHVDKYDLSSIRKLGCVGEPLNKEAWQWYHEVVGKRKLDIIDTWWQTETGGIMIAPRPSAPEDPILPAMPMRPFYGIDAQLIDLKSGAPIPPPNNERAGETKIDEEGYKEHEERRAHNSGALVIGKAWPGIARTLRGDHARFVQTYFSAYPGFYYSGDEALRTHHHHPQHDDQHGNSRAGYFQICGRLDDVINISGHRLGTAELEDVLDDNESVAESAVVGVPHEIKGEAAFAFVCLKEEGGGVTGGAQHAQIRDALKSSIRQRIAGYAVPDRIVVVTGLPKTRSGKIMRRILRKIAQGERSLENLGDVSTLAEPSIVQDLIRVCNSSE